MSASFSGETRVHWAGLGLVGVQDFQHQDDLSEAQRRHLLALTQGYAWGFADLSINEQALASGRLEIDSASGAFPDGTLFALDGQTPIERRGIVVDEESLGNTFALAVRRSGAQSVEYVLEEQATPKHRYITRNVPVIDRQQMDGLEKDVSVATLNTRLVDASTVSDLDTAILPLARINHWSAKDGVRLDTEFVPPCLRVQAAQTLDRELVHLHTRLSTSASHYHKLLQGTGPVGSGDLRNVLILERLNRMQAWLAHVRAHPVWHPERLYCACVEAIAELSTHIASDRQIPSLEPYNHASPGAAFGSVFDALRGVLDTQPDSFQLKLSALPEPQLGSGFWRVNLNADATLRQTGWWYVAYEGSDAHQVTDNIKIGPIDSIVELRNNKVPGVRTEAIPAIPNVTPETNKHYFRLAMDGAGSLAERLRHGEAMGLHCPFDVTAMTLWLIRE